MDQVPVQQPTITPNPMQQPSQKKINIRKFFNIGSWIVLFALLPLTVLIFLSQDSIPGDLFYPVKRSLENVILAAASVNPATRAAFRTDLTETRFKEAQSLVVSKSNTSGLSTFIDEVQAAQIEATNLKSDTERQKAEEKLTVKIQEYQSGLSTLEAKTEQNIIASAPNLPSATPNFALTPTFVPTPTPASIVILPFFKPQPTPTLTLTPTPIPTSILSPTIAPTPVAPQSENTQIIEQRRIVESIKETKEKLDKIKKDLEEKRGEKKENRERKNENERKDKEDKEKKDNSDRNK